MDVFLPTTSIKLLPKTAAQTIKKLESLHINTFLDLLNLPPNRYEDYTKIVPLSRLFGSEEKITVQGEVASVSQISTRRFMKIQKIVLVDEGKLLELTWFNQPYLLTLLKRGIRVQVSGIVRTEYGKKIMHPESWEIRVDAKKEPIHTGRLVPIYPEKRGLSSRTIREKIYWILNNVDFSSLDHLFPEKIMKEYHLKPEKETYQALHFPTSLSEVAIARNQLAFEELFTIQLSSLSVRALWEKEKVTMPLAYETHKKQVDTLVASLPFSLTKAQNRVVEEILMDIGQTKPMNRLLQGDVGSGKTVVAAIGAYVAFLNGFQTLLMAPTDILARQHFETLEKVFAALGKRKPSIVRIAAGEKAGKNKGDIIIGTHALIQKKQAFENVALVIIDEQHKFGVAQRFALSEKGATPHILTMTATPIPRTVFLTLYGELDLSVIDEMPKGRKMVTTYVVPPHKRQSAYSWMEKIILKEKAQAFIVCPLIEQSEKESMQQIRAATVEFEHLQKEIFPHLKLGLLHGKMKAGEKNRVMTQFSQGHLDILVSTPVVEVGVDIPNASIILIEAAERFGLASLHQMRGRVGRGGQEAYCLVMSDKQEKGVLQRLNTFAKIHDGMSLARFDLSRRGAGEMHGTRQHGIGELVFANLTDSHLVSHTQKAAKHFFDEFSLSDYPLLEKRLAARNAHAVARD